MQKDTTDPTENGSAYSGAWPRILLLIVGMVAGFVAGFWTGIMGLCFGAALIATGSGFRPGPWLVRLG